MNSPNENTCDAPPLIVKYGAAHGGAAAEARREVLERGRRPVVASTGLDPRSSSPTSTRPTWFSTGRTTADIESA